MWLTGYIFYNLNCNLENLGDNNAVAINTSEVVSNILNYTYGGVHANGYKYTYGFVIVTTTEAVGQYGALFRFKRLPYSNFTTVAIYDSKVVKLKIQSTTGDVTVDEVITIPTGTMLYIPISCIFK